MTPEQRAEALLHADDRPQSLNDDLYAWAVAAEKLLRTLAEQAQAPLVAIGVLLSQAMDEAVRNGANSVSMPDEYVEIAVWIAAQGEPT